jgi:hypothetical protein
MKEILQKQGEVFSTNPVLKFIIVAIGAIALLFSCEFLVPTAQTEAPIINPALSEFVDSVEISITHEDPAAKCYFTLDGTDPLPGESSQYVEPFTVDSTVVVKAIAVSEGKDDSDLAEKVFTKVLPKLEAVSISPESQNFIDEITITVEHVNAEATIKYTIDGTTPSDLNGLEYSGPVVLTNSALFQATAIAPGFANSEIISQSYTRIIPVLASPSISVDSGIYDYELFVEITHTEPTAQIWFTTNGLTPIAGSSNLYSAPISITNDTVLKVLASADDFANSDVVTRNYEVNLPTVTTPSIEISGNENGDSSAYLGEVQVSLSTATVGASIYYTTDGSVPSAGSTPYAGSFSVSGEFEDLVETLVIRAIAIKAGSYDSGIAQDTATIEHLFVDQIVMSNLLKTYLDEADSYKNAFQNNKFAIHRIISYTVIDVVEDTVEFSTERMSELIDIIPEEADIPEYYTFNMLPGKKITEKDKFIIVFEPDLSFNQNGMLPARTWYTPTCTFQLLNSNTSSLIEEFVLSLAHYPLHSWEYGYLEPGIYGPNNMFIGDVVVPEDFDYFIVFEFNNNTWNFEINKVRTPK